MDARPPGIDAFAIVIPVNDEAELLPDCIAALRVAIGECLRRRPGAAVTVRFALDRCVDESAEIIRAAGLAAVTSELPGVGAARAAGVNSALETMRSAAAERTLIASTDADSVVPRNWLTHMADLADEGSDIVVGPVRPRPDDLDDERRSAWEATHRDGQARGHVHGANLGIRGSVYLAVGGFAPMLEHEDVDLVSRASAAGARTRATDATCVITSGRLEGRTAGGYAGYLREQLLSLADSGAPTQAVA